MPLFYLSLAFMVGIIAADMADLPMLFWGLMALAAIGLLMLGWRRPTSQPARGWFPLPPLAALILLVCLGGACYQLSLPPDGPRSVAWHNDTGVKMAVVGLVVAPPDNRESYTNLRVRVERLRPGREVLHSAPEGVILARVPRGWKLGRAARFFKRYLRSKPGPRR